MQTVLMQRDTVSLPYSQIYYKKFVPAVVKKKKKKIKNEKKFQRQNLNSHARYAAQLMRRGSQS
jgi:hypothetical protein